MAETEVRTADGVRIWLEFCGAEWWKLHIDTGDYERIIDLNTNERQAIARLLTAG